MSDEIDIPGLPRRIIMVTGLSGSGKNVVMRALEDLGFYCVDNLPVPLVSTFLKFVFESTPGCTKVALSLDVRGKRFCQDFLREIDKLKGSITEDWQLRIIFLKAHFETLVNRFQETRRSHPIRGLPVTEAIEEERKLLSPVMDMADVILDTDSLNIHQLREWVNDSFSDAQARELLVNFISFGFKYGIPMESSLLYDVRFLPNPHFIPALKAHDGRTSEIQEYLFSQQSVQDCWQHLTTFLHYSIDQYRREWRRFVNVAIGCTGGKHRSVAFAEKLAQESWPGCRVSICHRDVNRE